MSELTVKRGGDAPRGGDCAADRETGTPLNLDSGWIEMVNPTTGNKILVRPTKQKPVEVKPKFPVPGLKVFETAMSRKFEWLRAEPIDEADARDAQCRAGWSDIEYAYGFFSFEVEPMVVGYRATWCCWKSCE